MIRKDIFLTGLNWSNIQLFFKVTQISRIIVSLLFYTEWYCAVRVDGGVILKTKNLREAQNILGTGSWQNQQAIIPMMGSLAGNPHKLPNTWKGGSMWWWGWSDINIMRRQCANVSPPGKGKEP